MANFAVRGVISDTGQRPVAGVLVRAFDKDLPSLKRDELLGEATTNAEGFYEILFTEERFRAHERGQADVYIEVVDQGGVSLGRSENLFNPEPEVRIDLTIARRDEGRRSEYEELLDVLTPLVEPLSLEKLTQDDLDFLVRETGTDLRLLAWIAGAARLGRDTDVPAEAFYGWARHRDMPLPREWAQLPDEGDADRRRQLLDTILSHLVETPARELGPALVDAVDANVIPRSVRAAIDDILRALRRSTNVAHDAIGRAIDEGTGTPLPQLTVRIFDLDAGPEPEDLGSEVTNEFGLFQISFGTAKTAADAARNLRLTLIDGAGKELLSTDVRVAADQPGVIDIKVPPAPAAEPPQHAIDRLAAVTELEVPAELATFLAGRGILTLGDIRQAGGLRHVDGLPLTTDHPAVQALEAHADLSRVSDDVKVNAAIIDNGFRSVAAIAETPLADFVNAVHKSVGDFKAAHLQIVAQAQTMFLKNVLTGFAADRANGAAVPLAFANDALPVHCGCDDCEAAVSPAAYLADLLGYATKHLKHGALPVDVAFLQNTFCQPFGDLPTDCRAVDVQVRQVRLCIEVLRVYLQAHPPPVGAATILENATRAYVLAAYTSLLAKAGTSYEEIRLARVSKPEERQALADRLGIELTVPRPDPITTPGDELDQLFLDPDPGGPPTLTERALERIFGLVDTTRDPLSEGVKFGDDGPAPELVRWNFAGPIWGSNTDEDGVVHIRFKNFITNMLVSEVEVYRDRDRTALVASGTGKIASGDRIVKLVSKNASGLSGSVKISGFAAENNAIEIAIIPKLLAWRLKYLRSIWRTQDFPVDTYSDDYLPPNERQAIVDPDLIGPDDFRLLTPASEPWSIWKKRRQWLDQRIVELASITKTMAVDGQSVSVPDLDKILARMYDPLAYDATSVQPWAASTPVAQFDAISDTLGHGTVDAVLAAKDRLARDLALSVDAFSRLIAIGSKHRQWEADHKSGTVQPEEWRELFSILVSAEKLRLFTAWIQEEHTAHILFGLEDFWRSLREPKEGDWPPVASNGHPLIDPDEVKLTDLPEPPTGQTAIQMWATRRDALAAAATTIKEKRESNGFDAMVSFALGHPKSGDPLQYDLATLKAELASTTPAVVAAATKKVTDDLHLTLDGFSRLLTLKDLAASPAPARVPAPAEWTDVYEMLTTAHKIKHLYPDWVGEENIQFGTEYWLAVKARLPRWRATADARQEWVQALRVRSRPPVIDPDLVDAADFNGLAAQPAFTIWQTRRDWVKDQIAGFDGKPKTLAGLDDIVATAVSVPVSDLVALDASRRKGEAIQPRLDQLQLTNAAFVHLLRIRELAGAGQPITRDEWESVYSILVQVSKQRLSARWREEERTKPIPISPDYFVMPDPLQAVAASPLDRWRPSQDERFDWLDTLQSRIDQEKTVLAAAHDLVSSVEETVLPALRDALVVATATVGADLDAMAAWTTDRFLIDAKADGCQKTTRIAQAIETLQALLFAARTGQSSVIQTLGVVLEAPHFDEEWRWIGSYAPWRSAMFVLIFPENIAVGSLRRHQTPAFRSLVRQLRGSRRLTSEQACALASEYAAYYEDIAKLAAGASCQAEVVERSGTRCVPGVLGRKPLAFMFGRGGVSNRIYWSTFDFADETGYAQSYWERVPGAPPASQIVGTAAYESSPTDRRIFLFFRTLEHKLQVITFNLETQDWADPIDLALPPGEPRSIETVLNQTNYVQYPPALAIRAQGDIYYRRLNVDGSGWADGDWKIFALDAAELNLAGVEQLLGAVENVLWIREGGQIEQRYTAGYSVYVSTDPKRVGADYIGAVLWGVARNAWDNWLIERRKDGTTQALPFPTGANTISDQFPIQGLKTVAPNCGGGRYATFVYERRNETPASVKGKAIWKFGAEPDGLYLRYDALSDVLTTTSRVAMTRRLIAPRAFPLVPGQFSIPSRLEGAAVAARSQAVALTLIGTSDSATNRTYPEEAYFFVPLMLADALRRSGEHVAALDLYRTAYDYTAPAGTQKVYYGLVEEESLPELYKRAPDWLLDPLDPHAIAATRRLTYTRFTLISIVRCLLEFADEEFTRDTAETIPRARNLYLTALTVLDLPELKQHLGACTDVIGELDIEIGPDAPVAAGVGINHLRRLLTSINDVSTLKALVPKVKTALAADTPWPIRVEQARRLVEEADATIPPPPTTGYAMARRADLLTDVSSQLLKDPALQNAADQTGRVAGAKFLNGIAATTGISPAVLENDNVALPWLRRNPPLAATRAVDFVLSPNLSPIAPQASLSLSSMLRPSGFIYGVEAHDGEPPVLPYRLPAMPPIFFTPVVAPSIAFCIPPNPLLASLRLHAELNLHKLRTCRNIAGMKREVDPYAAPTDTVTGLPTIGASGQLVLPGSSVLRPTLYRYATLIQRAKELVTLAQQIEASMLSAFEKRDAESYTLLKARQDLELAQAGVQLETLRLKQANDGVTLASLQQARAQIQADHYQKLLDEGLIELERGAIETLGEAAILQATAADLNFAVAAIYGATVAAGALAGGVAGAASGGPAGAVVGAAMGALGQQSAVISGLNALSAGYMGLAAKRSTRAQIQLTLASFERRREEWDLSLSLAKQDVAIGAQQVTIANDTVDVAKQEKAIAEIRNTQAKDTIEFLTNKFSNVELYDWMGDVLEGVYSFFLQQATSTAKLAETQLAFERQEPPGTFVQNDYWEVPGDGAPDTLQSSGPDRRGLTGSARLLQDLYRLDQYSFETNKRKLQLSKVISLAQVAPTEFQKLRETGVMNFATPMASFDRDFPGHYLRLIRRVRTSVIALIPPTQGIHATLTSAGVSRTVIGPEIFQTIPIRRDPEFVALTSPANASGVFELEAQQTDMLLPFEGNGVDATWEFRMPKAANQFDYRSFVDVLLTIEYTALHNFDYCQQVIQALNPNLSADRPFSFRNQFADQWYDLHNPEQTKAPMTVRFSTIREDFPPNLEALKIQQVLLYFVRADGKSFEVPVTHLHYSADGDAGIVGGSATSIDGIISTRRGNAGSWMAMIGKSPAGEWELALPNTEEMINRFKDEDILDILLVVTYSGRTPAWPN